MLSTSFRDFERKVREQFTEMFSMSGFDARRDIAGIILNRWGHHFIAPQPGFIYGWGTNPGYSSNLSGDMATRVAGRIRMRIVIGK